MLRLTLRAVAILGLAFATGCQQPAPQSPPLTAMPETPAPAPAMAIAPQFQAAMAAGKADYAALLARARQNDPQLDFFALRMSYANTPAYNPVNFLGPFRDGHRELSAGDFAGALAKVLPHLERNYVDSWAHFVAAEAYQGQGKTAEADHHRYMEQGLRRSLVARNRARSFEDAIVVISVTEEYVVLLSAGYLPQGQALVNRQGMAYDQLKVRHQRTQEETTLYFIANIPLSSYEATMKRDLQAKPPR